MKLSDQIEALDTMTTPDEAFVEAMARAASETERLSRELDITNADHIVLWLETNLAAGCGATLGYLACRIIEAHEAEQARVEKETLERAAGVASLYIIKGNSIHPDISLSDTSEQAKMIAHTTCQHVAHAIRALPLKYGD